MSILSAALPALGDRDVSLETFSRQGNRIRQIDGKGLIEAIRVYRMKISGWRVNERKLVGLLFRSEETIEFLVAALAAIAEGYTVVPLYPNWNEETQLLYLTRYRIRSLAVGEGFANRAARWGRKLERTLQVTLDLPAGERALATQLEWEVFPSDLRDDHPCAWIFTSGTSGELAKCTEITLGNLNAAVENICGLDFLREGMVVHSPLSASHIFAFVVIMGFIALKPRRMIFSDVQYLSRLPEEKTGRIDALILVPIVVNRMRASFYEKLAGEVRGKPDAAEPRKLKRVPSPVRRALKRMARMAENSLISLEQGRRRGAIGYPAVLLTRALFGKMIQRRLGSPEFVVVGGAKPSLNSMALLEVMGVRCLQGWGMTETTGPLAVCNPRDRFRGAFGTCGDLFPDAGGFIEGGEMVGELVVEGPQIARGYVEPDGTLVPFNGRMRTGDTATFDRRRRLQVIGKASDRITTDNGLNYNPIPLEDNLSALDLEKRNLVEEAVVVGDGKARLGAVFFLREGVELDENVRGYVRGLVGAYNASRPVDEKIGPWAISERSLREVGGLGPSGKLVRRRIEESFSHIYGDVLV